MREPFHLGTSTREALLAAAHEAIEQVVLHPESTANVASVEENGVLFDDGVPSGAAGVFVSLHVRGNLRGCLGTWSLERSLRHSVSRMAKAAATSDGRFRPLSPEEVPQVSVEISVVGAPRALAPPPGPGWTLGEQGLTVACGAAQGVLLPQVALTHHLDRRAFLEATCEKAGLARDAWKTPQTKVMSFDAEVFGDSPAINHR